jgi:hypothetical protein
MAKKPNNNPPEKKKSLLSALLDRPEKDTAYMSDLQGQWDRMSRDERVKFVLGAVFGLVLFVAALIGVFLLINFLRNLIF